MEHMIIKSLYRGCIQNEFHLLNNLGTQFTLKKGLLWTLMGFNHSFHFLESNKYLNKKGKFAIAFKTKKEQQLLLIAIAIVKRVRRN